MDGSGAGYFLRFLEGIFNNDTHVPNNLVHRRPAECSVQAALIIWPKAANVVGPLILESHDQVFEFIPESADTC